MMRIFEEWTSTCCVTYDQNDQPIQLKMIISKEDLLSQVRFQPNEQLFANFSYEKSTLQPFHKIVNSNLPNIHKPLPTKQFSYEEINELPLRLLKLDHPCHNKAVEQHVKLVIEASVSTTDHETRNRMTGKDFNPGN